MVRKYIATPQGLRQALLKAKRLARIARASDPPPAPENSEPATSFSVPNEFSINQLIPTEQPR